MVELKSGLILYGTLPLPLYLVCVIAIGLYSLIWSYKLLLDLVAISLPPSLILKPHPSL